MSYLVRIFAKYVIKYPQSTQLYDRIASRTLVMLQKVTFFES